MLIAHLSDLHLRDADDAVRLEGRLDRIAARNPDHLVITGDLLDRWTPYLLDRVLDALGSRQLLAPARLTILHGNHDLASSGGHPRGRADLWRLAARFWDPPPLLAWRRRRFYEGLARHAPLLGAEAPFSKTAAGGLRIVVLDTIPFPWRPLEFHAGGVAVRHGIGCVRPAQAAWLARQPRQAGPLVMLIHHYPLDAPPYRWTPASCAFSRFANVSVPMHIPAADRTLLWDAAVSGGVNLILCGHVHRAHLDHHRGIAVGLNGQSGASWAGRPIAWYTLRDDRVEMELESLQSR